jgi:hypothetical protein
MRLIDIQCVSEIPRQTSGIRIKTSFKVLINVCLQTVTEVQPPRSPDLNYVDF